MSESSLLTNPDFLSDCSALSQRQIEAKYGGNGLGRAALRNLYKQAQNGHAEPAEDVAREEPSQYLTTFFEGKQVDEQVDEKSQLRLHQTPLFVVNATFGESQKLHKQAMKQAGDCFETLRQILERKAYLHLGCLTFRDYIAKFKRDVGYMAIDHATFYRKLAHKEVVTILCDAGVDTRSLTQQHAAVLNKLPESVIPDAYRRAQELSNEEPPAGKGGEFHHPGKVYLDKLEQAVQEVADQVSGTEDADPFEPEPEPARPTRQDFFDEQNRAKPLPPQDAAETTQQTRSEEKEPSRLGYVRMTRHTGKEGDFLSIVGDDGYEEYEILARVEDVRRMLK